MSDLILVADDDRDIRRFVELNLRVEGFDVVSASSGEEALQIARERLPALALLDVMMPGVSGYEVCRRLRWDCRTNFMSIIMLTAKTLATDKVIGLTAGADDYIGKPFDPQELIARVHAALRRSREMRAVSPLTGLPGNVHLESELRRRVQDGREVAVVWLDLDNFKGFNDRYGFTRGDRAINYLADVVRSVSEETNETFIAHIGGDDFIVLAPVEGVERYCEAIIRRFDEGVPRLYDVEDAGRGSIEVTDRRGNPVSYPLLSVSIGVATNRGKAITDYRELVAIATEMKSFAKEHPGSFCAVDRRGHPGRREHLRPVPGQGE